MRKKSIRHSKATTAKAQAHAKDLAVTLTTTKPGAPMPANEYLKTLDALGIPNRRAGDIFGFSLTQSKRYANGLTPIPEPLAKLLRLARRHDIPVNKIKQA